MRISLALPFQETAPGFSSARARRESRVLPLRRRKTRYKNPQLGAQHCFVASLGRCLPFFTLHDQLVAQQQHLLRVKLITEGEKRETSTKTCNKTILRDKLRVFVSRLSLPLYCN